MEQPLITIGITCFNAERTIGRAIESALKQDWPRFEVLVVDDGSDDGSVACIRQVAMGDSRIHLLRHDVNRGYPAALNTIRDNASGEFIAIFDDDDESKSWRLSSQYESLRSYENANDTKLVACYSNRTVVLPDGETRRVHCIGRAPPQPHGEMVADFLLLNERQCGFVFGEFGSCTLMARASTFRTTGPFDTTFRRCAEWDWAIRLAFLHGHFIGVDHHLVTQYITRTADKAGRTPLLYTLLLRRKHRAYLNETGDYWFSVLMAYVRFHYSKGRYWRSRFYYFVALMVSPSRLMRRRRQTPGRSDLRQRNDAALRPPL